jgi:hypothetical protein
MSCSALHICTKRRIHTVCMLTKLHRMMNEVLNVLEKAKYMKEYSYIVFLFVRQIYR